MKNVSDSIYHMLDVSSVGVIVGVLLGWMPNLAAVLTVLWLGARLYNEVMVAVYRRRDRAGRKPR